MYAAEIPLPNWRKIGRRVGRGLRDWIPSQDRDPSPRERRAQRLRDVFKGFAYFDNFEEVIAWSEADVDPFKYSSFQQTRSIISLSLQAPSCCAMTVTVRAL